MVTYTKKSFNDENEMLEYANKVRKQSKYLHSWNFDNDFGGILAIFIQGINLIDMNSYMVESLPITNKYEISSTEFYKYN